MYPPPLCTFSSVGDLSAYLEKCKPQALCDALYDVDFHTPRDHKTSSYTNDDYSDFFTTVIGRVCSPVLTCRGRRSLRLDGGDNNILPEFQNQMLVVTSAYRYDVDFAQDEDETRHIEVCTDASPSGLGGSYLELHTEGCIVFTGPRAETSSTPSTAEQFPIAVGDWVLACARLHKRCAPHGRAVALEIEATHIRVLAGLSPGKEHASTGTLHSFGAEQSLRSAEDSLTAPVTPLKRKVDPEPSTSRRYRTRRVAKAEETSYPASNATWSNSSVTNNDAPVVVNPSAS